MKLENLVLLIVVVVDALILGLSLWMRWTVINNPTQRQAAFKMMGFTNWLFCLSASWFCVFELYQWYAVKQLYCGPAGQISLADHPWLFRLSGRVLIRVDSIWTRDLARGCEIFPLGSELNRCAQKGPLPLTSMLAGARDFRCPVPVFKAIDLEIDVVRAHGGGYANNADSHKGNQAGPTAPSMKNWRTT
jgi:hypothetical protein